MQQDGDLETNGDRKSLVKSKTAAIVFPARNC